MASLTAFLIKLGVGVTLIIFGALAVALSLAKVLFWPAVDLLAYAALALGALGLVGGIFLMFSCRNDLDDPNLAFRVLRKGTATKWRTVGEYNWFGNLVTRTILVALICAGMAGVIAWAANFPLLPSIVTGFALPLAALAILVIWSSMLD